MMRAVTGNSSSVLTGEYCQLRKLRALSFEPKRPTGMPRRLQLARNVWTCGVGRVANCCERRVVSGG